MSAIEKGWGIFGGGIFLAMYWCALSGRSSYNYDKNFEEEKYCNIFLRQVNLGEKKICLLHLNPSLTISKVLYFSECANTWGFFFFF